MPTSSARKRRKARRKPALHQAVIAIAPSPERPQHAASHPRRSVFSVMPWSTLGAAAVFALTLFGAHSMADHSKGMALSRLPQLAASIADFDIRTTPLLPVERAQSRASEVQLVHPAASQLLLDSPGLDHFYQALWSGEQNQRTTPIRIVHYGDSPTTADLITGDNRQQLQQRWGNAGNGYILIAKPWAWYEHRDVELEGSGWQTETAVGNKEGDYGLGGASFTGSAGAVSRIRFKDHSLSRVELFYQAQPTGGTLAITADGHPLRTVDTHANAAAPAFITLDLPPNTSGIELRPASGSVRLYGLSLEKSGPGITYDSLGLNGASTMVLSHVFRQEHWAAELQHRNPDLVIINYGTNESSYISWIDKQYEKELRTAIARVRAALPGASILIMSPMDRGEHAGGSIQTAPGIPRIVEIQKRVALDTGCAFFNTFEAMGGASTMARWYGGHPRMVAADLIHPSPQGARLISESLVRELTLGLNRYKVRRFAQMQAANAPAVSGAEKSKSKAKQAQ